jgi:hypothetical protein
MRNWILLLVASTLIMGLTGCATTTPKIDVNKYLNKEFGFSAVIPDGWIPYNELTDAQRQRIDSLIKTEGILVLADSSSNGILAASGYRNSDYWSNLNLDLYRGVPVFFKEQITNSITKTIENEINPDHYSLDVSPSGFQKTNRNWKRDRTDFEPAFIAGFTYPIRHSSGITGAYTQIASYPCHGGQICALWITLMFKQSELSENMKTLRTFKSSIRAHDKGFP